MKVKELFKDYSEAYADHVDALLGAFGGTEKASLVVHKPTGGIGGVWVAADLGLMEISFDEERTLLRHAWSAVDVTHVSVKLIGRDVPVLTFRLGPPALELPSADLYGREGVRREELADFAAAVLRATEASDK